MSVLDEAVDSITSGTGRLEKAQKVQAITGIITACATVFTMFFALVTAIRTPKPRK